MPLIRIALPTLVLAFVLSAPAAAQEPAARPFGAPPSSPPAATPDSLVPPAATPAPAPAEEAVPIVGRITVVGNVQTDSARVLRTFEVRSGEPFSNDAVRRGTRKLFALGVFDDIAVDRGILHDGVIDLIIRVTERPRIARIEFSGNKKKDNSDLEKKLFVRAGETYAATTVATQIDTLLKVYREAGYPQAAIDAVTDTLPGNQVALRFVVREGEKVRITRVVFHGVSAFPEKKLRKQLKTKTRGFFGGGEPDESKFAEDREKLEGYYHNHGYRDARLVSETVQPGGRPRSMTLTLEIEEGRPYQQGEVHWSGNQVVAGEDLEKMWRPKPGDRYDASKIDKTSQAAYAEYAERGYLYLQIEPRETVRADSVVDVTYGITEGQPSHVRYVRIAGNHGTREKVIRREIDIHEGDRFKRSALVRTQGDIFRLGLFEDVQVDFSPAESTDVDINLKVKEKQVGTASAGAGYTNESGLTGFLELGHNNVMGNGQAISLHLERGANTENYYLSFTEPWFRDTPTLLGFSAFNTLRELDLYKEKRVGGSGRIGRPLPWPDYSRGSVTYQLENVTISELNAVTTPADSIALAGLKPGQAVLTSSLELDFLRNSTNNPFYPTQGTRFTIQSELAGGPFAGAVNFHKHRIEGRIYLPSLLKPFTTMVRARVGLVDEYPDQHFDVPPYERFRLGGGTTIDPLRGYDDYQVVPPQYDRVVRNGIASIDTTTRDTTYHYTRVRYPGGRFMTLYTVEQQFPIVHPLHGVLFFDAGNTWDRLRDARPLDLKMGAGAGIRLEIPLLGNIGFDYGYGFNRDDGPKAVGHFLLGNVNF